MFYFRLFATYIRVGVLGELEYRANFWINLIQSALDLSVALGGLAVVFSHTDTLGGWRPAELLALMLELSRYDKVGAMDVVEVAPPFDPSGNTALVGATFMFEILCLLADRVARQGG